ncbi:hypothetical protein EYW49_20080 [Siculibacillus lacustris]|uniref:Uncharacterized protein n=1 Tax=Siculibacillus lacustris TaxID=1549641 RepID=A0A4Q9VFB9_9HYPH|nr:hypothetical protein [Siculibacillus lacustris]TBW33582.1 hypothetical protein EYW49_20080 [Siculibacillus lacustris]
MTHDPTAVLTAVRSVLGPMASPQTAEALYAALRPIAGEEAACEADHKAMIHEENGLRKAKSRTGRDKARASMRAASDIATTIRTAMCQEAPSNG